MSVLGSATLRGTVTVEAATATLYGYVSGTPAATVTGTVDGALAAAAEGSSAVFGVRVMLAGVDVSADLAGRVTTSVSLDTWRRTAAFELFGPRYSPLVTSRTWSRGTAVEIYFAQGVPGQVVERLELRGIVDTCSPAGEYRWSVRCADQGLRFEHGAVCHYVPPLLGQTRGEVAATVAGAFGAQVVAPDGAVWTKALQSAGRTLREILEPFAEPELWHWRWTDDVAATLEAYAVDLDAPPVHRWHTDDFLALPEVTPAAGIASRWVLRGATGAGIADADGEGQVAPQEYSAVGEFAPAVADEEQDTAGVVTATGVAPGVPVVQEIRHTKIEQTYSGGRLTSQRVTDRTWGFHPGAKYSTESLGAGAGPNGWDFVASYIAAGRYVTRIRETFGAWNTEIIHTSRAYHPDAPYLLTETTRTYRYHWIVERAIQTQSSGAIDHVARITQDGVSYQRKGASPPGVVATRAVGNEWQGLFGTPGPIRLRRQTITDLELYARRCAIDTASPTLYLNASGRGMVSLEGSHQRVSQTVRDFVPDGQGAKGGVVTSQRYGWRRDPKPDGAHDWGDFRSDLEEEEWGTIGPPTASRYEVLQDGAYVQVGGDTVYYEGRASARSAVEAVIDDPLLREWMGHQSAVAEHPYVQSAAEATKILRRRLRRAASVELVVSRPEHLAELGDVVEIEGDLEFRGLVTDIDKVRDAETGEATAEYVLEVYKL